MVQLVEGRTCGGCTLCCKTHAILSIGKEPGTWCKDCKIGVGCTRYKTRPSECETFECGWLAGFGLEQDRPDKSRIVLGVDLVEGLGDDVWTIHETRSGALEQSESAQEWMRRGMGMRMPVFIERDHGRSKLLIPKDTVLSEEVKKALKERNIAVHRYWPAK